MNVKPFDLRTGNVTARSTFDTREDGITSPHWLKILAFDRKWILVLVFCEGSGIIYVFDLDTNQKVEYLRGYDW